jgi:hypothetical protein
MTNQRDEDPSRLLDPFSDRLARNIRNSLSTALVEELTGQEGAAVVTAAGQWLQQELPEVYRNHIEHRRRQYHEAIDAIQSAGVTEPRQQAVVLWNAGLFFELHELLETLWTTTRGAERTALKGVIQAAGAYVHHRRGKPDAGRKLADKAINSLREGSAHLGFIGNPEALVRGLRQLEEDPPVLEIGGGA